MLVLKLVLYLEATFVLPSKYVVYLTFATLFLIHMLPSTQLKYSHDQR